VREPANESSANGPDENGKRLRLLSWNIGYGDLEQETGRMMMIYKPSRS